MEKSLQDQDWERLGQYLAGEMEGGEKLAFEASLQEKPELQKAYEQAQQLWQTEEASPKSIDTDAAWEKLQARIQPIQGGKVRSLRRRSFRLASIAAMLLILVSLALWQWNSAPSYLQKQTAPGVSLSLSLADGSEVWLNETSSLRYPERMQGKSRKVRLQGEAYFEVARQPDKPFLVETELGTIKVLGTQFNVRAYPGTDQVEVSVTEGKVLVFEGKKLAADSSNARILLAGESALLDKQASQPQKFQVNQPNFLAWKTGELYLQNLQLEEIAELLNRYVAGSKIKVAKEAAGKTFYAEAPFGTDSLEEILQSLALSLDLQIEQQGDSLLLK
jgi:transmembrane sensor